MAIQLEARGRRVYIRGNTYPIKDTLRAAGAKWDPEERAWWVGPAKRGAIEALLASAPSSARPEATEAPGEDAVVAGRVTYRGKVYYLAGRSVRGRTYYDFRVDAVTSRDGTRVLLYYRDGSRQFWASAEEVRIERTYDRPQTIGRLRRFAEQRKAGRCPVCARHCTCDKGWCQHHHDGCEACGAER